MTYNVKSLSRLGPSGVFGKVAMELGEQYDNIGIFTADLRHFSGLDRFGTVFPDKLFNVGIAEQNLIGVAAGFASEGNIAFATTYASFASMRCLDQVFMNMAYMNLNVKLVGFAAGLSTGILGPTHMSINDMAIFRSLPNITILSPADGMEIVEAVKAAAEINGPVYIRLTGALDNPVVYDNGIDYVIGKANKLHTGDDITIFSTGTMVYESLKASEILSKEGIGVSVYDVHTIRPFDTESMIDTMDAKLFVTVEEHGIAGGLGDTVLCALNEIGEKKQVLKIGIPCEWSHSADYSALKEKYDLVGDRIANTIHEQYVNMRKEIL